MLRLPLAARLRTTMRPALMATLLTLPALGPALAEDISIPGPEGALHGEAIAVEGAEHAIVIIPGSGPTNRDGDGPEGQPGLRSGTYRLLAEALAEAGIASVRVDKRGMFTSAGAIPAGATPTLEGYASDAAAWVTRAADYAPCVWLAGHSEGGLVALIAAQEPPDALCGLILLSAPGRPIGTILREQLAANPATAGVSDAVDRAVTALESGETVALTDLPGSLHALLPPWVQPYMIDLFSWDPAALARNWTGPTILVHAGRDMQIAPTDADTLAEALPQALRIDLPDATHMLKTDVPGQPYATYLDPALPLAPALVPALAEALDSLAPPSDR